jgi:diazepam-binding inhibitor (GABA receptor modulator, acyl-CoA-binding protein)
MEKYIVTLEKEERAQLEAMVSKGTHAAQKMDRVKRCFVEEGLEAVMSRQPSTLIYAGVVDGDLGARLVALSCILRSPSKPVFIAPTPHRPTTLCRKSSMSDLKARFEQAAIDSKQLPERPDNATLLRIYALYKQATDGNASGDRPGFTDMVGRAKWDAWHELQGRDRETAQQEYVDLIESLK